MAFPRRGCNREGQVSRLRFQELPVTSLILAPEACLLLFGPLRFAANCLATAGETNEAVSKAAWELLGAVNAREDARSARN